MRSCEEYAESGITLSDLYEIDPDGAGVGDPSFLVFCNFENGSKTFVKYGKNIFFFI